MLVRYMFRTYLNLSRVQLLRWTIVILYLLIIQPGRGDGRAAAKGLELGINNLSVVVNLLR